MPFGQHTRSGDVEPMLWRNEGKGADEMAQLVKMALLTEFNPQDPREVAA